MFRTITHLLIMLSFIAIYNGKALASDNGHNHTQQHQSQRVGDLYSLQVDPLGDSLMDVANPITHIHKGRDLRFANEKNVQLFKSNPNKYLAQVDAQIIELQKPLYPLTTCIVSGEALGGSMGKPLNRVFGNRLVRFCCASCVRNFKKSPSAYLAKIDAAVIVAQKKNYPLNTCLVSGEKFGGQMGKPVDYVIGNQLVTFCCKGCINMFKKNPAKYLGKLKNSTKDHGASTNHQGHNH